MDIFLLTTQLFDPWICATFEISFSKQAQLPTTDLYIVGLLGSISLFLDNPRVKKSSIKLINQAPSTRIKLQTQEIKFQAQVTSYIIKTERG